jgi:hypothetical protein
MLFKKQKTIYGILTQDVFNHSLLYDDVNCVMYLEEQEIEFKPYQIYDIKQKLETSFAVLATIVLSKNGEIKKVTFQQIFKVIDSEENDGTTKIKFFYKRGGFLYQRNVSKPSIRLNGFQSSGVLKPWFKISAFDTFDIIPENTPYFYDVGYFSSIDYSASAVDIPEPEVKDDFDYSFKIDDDLGF